MEKMTEKELMNRIIDAINDTDQEGLCKVYNGLYPLLGVTVHDISWTAEFDWDWKGSPIKNI